jgi:hypothetical protein
VGESSKEGYGSKRALLPTTKMMMMMTIMMLMEACINYLKWYLDI